MVEQVEHALGDPELPLSDAQRLQKHRALLALASFSTDGNLQRDIDAIASATGNPTRLLDRAFHGTGLKFVSGRADSDRHHSKENA